MNCNSRRKVVLQLCLEHRSQLISWNDLLQNCSLVCTYNSNVYPNKSNHLFQATRPIEKETQTDRQEHRNTLRNTKEHNYNSYSYENANMLHNVRKMPLCTQDKQLIIYG